MMQCEGGIANDANWAAAAAHSCCVWCLPLQPRSPRPPPSAPRNSLNPPLSQLLRTRLPSRTASIIILSSSASAPPSTASRPHFSEPYSPPFADGVVCPYHCFIHFIHLQLHLTHHCPPTLQPPLDSGFRQFNLMGKKIRVVAAAAMSDLRASRRSSGRGERRGSPSLQNPDDAPSHDGKCLRDYCPRRGSPSLQKSSSLSNSDDGKCLQVPFVCVVYKR